MRGKGGGARSVRWDLGQRGPGLSISSHHHPTHPISHRRSPRCRTLAPRQREELSRERSEQRKLRNSSWVLGQPKPGAVSRKNQIILEKRQQCNFQHPLQVAAREGSEGEGREISTEAFLPRAGASAVPQTWKRDSAALGSGDNSV